MIEKSFIITTPYASQDCSRIMPSAFNDVDCDNVKLTRNFDHTTDLGKVVRIYQDGDNMVADVLIYESESVTGLSPAIGFNCHASDCIAEEGFTVVNKINLVEISLCGTANADPNIKPIE